MYDFIWFVQSHTLLVYIYKSLLKYTNENKINQKCAINCVKKQNMGNGGWDKASNQNIFNQPLMTSIMCNFT